jgi:hypothetical protein
MQQREEDTGTSNCRRDVPAERLYRASRTDVPAKRLYRASRTDVPAERLYLIYNPKSKIV